MNFANFSVKTRLWFTVGVLVTALISVSVAGISALKQSSEDIDTIFNQQTRSVALLGSIYGSQLRIVQELDLALAMQDAEMVKAAQQEIAENSKKIVDDLANWERLISSPEGRQLYADIVRARDPVLAASNAVSEAVNAGDYVKAFKLRKEQLEPAFKPLRENIEGALAFQMGSAEEASDQSQRNYRSNRTIVLSLSAIAVVIGIVFGFLLIRSIMRSLGIALALSNKIAEGQLGNAVQIESNDEFGTLLGSLQQMDAKLNEIVGGVRTAADSVGGAAYELTQGNDDLSQRTQEQAAALEETASSMEQMTATVKQNADNARQANQLATSARGQAEKGGAVVASAVSAMAEINASSRKIADIISVIDEIAFQTNLLALNAAVEAARAGEQGRGFAVVATEVRSLAQRSASAAKEIKELINDSVGKVRAGSELVEASGKTLEEIMDSVKKVSDIVAEIAAASEEQATGIDQVNNAVTQMDDTTQQNAALVEQAAAASKAMQMQAQQLVKDINFFRSSSDTPARSVPAVVAVAPAARAAVSQFTPRVARSQPVRAAISPAPLQKASGDSWQEF